MARGIPLRSNSAGQDRLSVAASEMFSRTRAGGAVIQADAGLGDGVDQVLGHCGVREEEVVVVDLVVKRWCQQRHWNIFDNLAMLMGVVSRVVGGVVPGLR